MQLFASLCGSTFSEFVALRKAYENRESDDGALLAWRARNLLELSVWCHYCAESRANARRVYEDAGRDVVGICDAFVKWGTASQSPNDLQPIENVKRQLFERARRVGGIDSLEGAYKRTADAAKECGIANHYELCFKMLSKFAHPTAMRLLAEPDEKKESVQRDFFFGNGCAFFVSAFDALEPTIEKCSPLR